MFLRVAVFTGLLASATAFAPVASRTPTSNTALRAEAEKTELLVDENFDGVNLVGLMGLNRLKKISRRHNRKLSDRIRNFEVVQDGRGLRSSDRGADRADEGCRRSCRSCCR